MSVDFVRSLLLPTVCSYKRRPSIAVASAYSWILSQQECQTPEKYNATNYGKGANDRRLIPTHPKSATASSRIKSLLKKILHSSTLFVAVPIPSVMSVGFAARQPKTAKKAKAIGSFAALYFFAALLLLLLLLLFQPGQNTKFPLDPSRRSASTTVLRETATRLLLVGVWWAEVSVLVHALVSCPLVFLVG